MNRQERRTRVGQIRHAVFGSGARSLTPYPSDEPEDAETVKAYPPVKLQPLSDLDLMIENGWGDTPQTSIPADWRTHKKSAKKPAAK